MINFLCASNADDVMILRRFFNRELFSFLLGLCFCFLHLLSPYYEVIGTLAHNIIHHVESIDVHFDNSEEVAIHAHDHNNFYNADHIGHRHHFLDTVLSLLNQADNQKSNSEKPEGFKKKSHKYLVSYPLLLSLKWKTTTNSHIWCYDPYMPNVSYEIKYPPPQLTFVA